MKCFLDGKSFIIIRPNIPNTQGRDFWGRSGEVCTEAGPSRGSILKPSLSFPQVYPAAWVGATSQAFFTDFFILAASSFLDPRSFLSPEVVRKGGFLSAGKRLPLSCYSISRSFIVQAPPRRSNVFCLHDPHHLEECSLWVFCNLYCKTSTLSVVAECRGAYAGCPPGTGELTGEGQD